MLLIFPIVFQIIHFIAGIVKTFPFFWWLKKIGFYDLSLWCLALQSVFSQKGGFVLPWGIAWWSPIIPR